MPGSLFITGSTGFIGSNLLRRIDARKYDTIYCLSRHEKSAEQVAEAHNIRFIKGDIYDAKIYGRYLESSDVVLHLAAATGKARPQEYLNVNTEGTKLFTEQCKQFGVRNFLYMSTIAVKFQDKSRYYYAQSKKKAEDVVRKSGLNYVILRPTIVLGKEAPIWRSLFQLARAPFIPLFGDGTAKIQPIYVDDLVDVIQSVVDEKMFFNETLELGGPEVNTMEVFLKRIHQMVHKKEPRLIHLPLRQLIPALSVLEQYLYTLMPFTVGQLAAFENDSSIEPNRLYQQHRLGMKNISTMLKLLIGDN